jgi:transposase
MIVRTLKLKLTKAQEAKLSQWLWHLTGVYNWAIKKIERNAANKIYFSQKDFQNLLSGHSRRMDVPSHISQGTLSQAYTAWQRCFKKLAKKPRLKGKRNKLNSIPFFDPVKPPTGNRITLLGLGSVKYHKQPIPEAKIKCGRIVKRASGWYLCLWLDCNNVFPVKQTEAAIGIDPGFDTLLTLSDGTKIENPRELHKGATRMAQAQRACNKKLTARLQERQANRRNDRNHKISRYLVENYATIYYSNDNFKAMAHLHGKSTTEAALGDLLKCKLPYKSRIGGRKLEPVCSRNTTLTCGNCWSLTGPTGLAGLKVRHWACTACGAVHDRDLNSAKVVLSVGLGTSHERGIRYAT